MNPGRDLESTADQDQWRELARAVRGQLLRLAEQLPAMEPAEVKDYVEACRDALFLEQNAATFDKDVDLLLQRLSYREET